MSKQRKLVGDEIWRRVEKVNSELFTLTYGSLVAQLVKDFENYEEVNIQLEKMGYNIGCRLIDDFLAKSGLGKCTDFRDTAEVISKVGFRMFLGITPAVVNWSQDLNSFSLIFDENPLAEYVELPEDAGDLFFSNILCGVIRGALEMASTQSFST